MGRKEKGYEAMGAKVSGKMKNLVAVGTEIFVQSELVIRDLSIQLFQREWMDRAGRESEELTQSPRREEVKAVLVERER